MVLVGTERHQALLIYGFPAPYLAELRAPSHRLSRELLHDGADFGDIADLDFVRRILPAGRIAPVRHVVPEYMWYELLVEDGGSWRFIHWSDEAGEEPISGALHSLTELMVQAWEEHQAAAAELSAWGRVIGHPYAETVVEALQNRDESSVPMDFVEQLVAGLRDC